MLNNPLFNVLKKHFGEVRVTNEGQRRVENSGGVIYAGETYSVNCPLCGDTKFRLSVSYMWLTTKPLAKQRLVHLANCYNENCNVRHESFYGKLMDDLELAKLGELALPTPVEVAPAAPVERAVIRLPAGCVPLAALPGDHPAVTFVRSKYPFFPVDYLTTYYGVMYCAEGDPIYPLSGDRIVFPIFAEGDLVAWQGRTIHPGVEPRWYLPSGMRKVVYNLDRLPPASVPVICEGIPAAIACGPEAVAIFGKTMTDDQCRALAAKHRTVLIATDPDTFVEDPRGTKKQWHAQLLKKKLQRFMPVEPKMLKWPADILEQAELYVNRKAQSCPDAADLGYLKMKEIIDASLAPG